MTKTTSTSTSTFTSTENWSQSKPARLDLTLHTPLKTNNQEAVKWQEPVEKENIKSKNKNKEKQVPSSNSNKIELRPKYKYIKKCRKHFCILRLLQQNSSD